MKKEITLPRLLFFFFITTVIITEFTLSKYSTIATASDSVTVALLANDVTTTITAPQNIYPGSNPVIIPITVTNKENDKVCQVSETFVFDLITNENPNIPLEYSICKNSTCTSTFSKNSDGFYTDSTFNFQAGTEESKTFYLKVYWPEQYNDSSYAFEVDYVNLKFIITQKD